MRILKIHPLLKLVNANLIDSPQPSNIRYLNLPGNPHGFKPFPCKSAGDWPTLITIGGASLTNYLASAGVQINLQDIDWIDLLPNLTEETRTVLITGALQNIVSYSWAFSFFSTIVSVWADLAAHGDIDHILTIIQAGLESEARHLDRTFDYIQMLGRGRISPQQVAYLGEQQRGIADGYRLILIILRAIIIIREARGDNINVLTTFLRMTEAQLNRVRFDLGELNNF